MAKHSQYSSLQRSKYDINSIKWGFFSVYNNDKEGVNQHLIADLPTRERPRERLLSHGAAALSDTELLAIILRSGPRGQSTLDLAREILRQFDGSLRRLANADPVEFTQVKGIGKAKSAELCATFALASRMAQHLDPVRPRINGAEDAFRYLRGLYQGVHQEELRCVLLNSKNHVIKHTLVTKGLLDRSHIHARELFRSAIQHNAAKIVLAHNHPSGDPTPSSQDISSTREMVAAGKIIGIDIIDHIILGDPSADSPSAYYSLRDNGFIK
jgi:DNA repair protein RadC